MIHYEIKSGDRLIYSSFRANQDFAATNIKLVEEVGKVPTLTFDLPPDNPVTLEVIKDEVQMYRNGVMIFNGNVKTRKRKFNKFVTYSCEGDIGYLHDILIRPTMEGTDTEAGFVRDVLAAYRSGHGAFPKRHLSAGTLDAGEEITYNIEDYTDCYDAITDNLFSVYNGGFLRTRHVESGGSWTHYVDFFAVPPADPNAQKIVYAKNILDINDDDDGRDVVTHYIPLGATVDKDRVKLAGATDYIEADSATLNDYGVIELVQDYSDVEDSGTLGTYANQDYAAMGLSRKKRAVKIKAVDMAIVNNAEAPLQVGYLYDVYSHPHGIEFTGGDKKQLLRAEIDPNNPDKCYYWFGDVPKDSMRRIQADRALAEDTRQRVQKEASYTNAVGSGTNEDDLPESYISLKSTNNTGNEDLTTASGVYTVTLSRWNRINVESNELKPSSFNVSGNISITSGSTTTGGSVSGIVTADSGMVNRQSRLFKATASVALHKSLTASCVVTVIDASGTIIGSTVNNATTNPTVNLFAVSANDDGTDLPANVKIAIIAIGTETGGTA